MKKGGKANPGATWHRRRHHNTAVGGNEICDGFEEKNNAWRRIVGVNTLLAVFSVGEEEEEKRRDFGTETKRGNDERTIVPEFGKVFVDQLEELGTSRNKRSQMYRQEVNYGSIVVAGRAGAQHACDIA